MFAAAGRFTILRVRDPSAKGRPRGYPGAEVTVFSFVGVLGITLVLFFVVALTGRLILGR